MRQKTYLTPEQQWDRTVALAVQCDVADFGREYLGLDKSWYIGRIAEVSRLFLPGDFVIVQIRNGQAERQPVWGVSSKGRAVEGFYLGYSNCSLDKPLWGKFYSIRILDCGLKKVVSRTVKRRCHRPLKHGIFDQGPLRLIEVPEHLVGLPPDAPPLRQYIVALAREGWRMPGKRE